MQAIININSDALVVYANKLESISKNALPKAVRNTITATAFDVKKGSIPESAADSFIIRKPTFLKANSTVVPAKGNDIATMSAEVGFKPIANDRSKAVEDLEQQEYGGTIGGRSFVPLKQARTGKNWRKTVRKQYRISDIKGEIFDSANTNLHGAKNPKEAFTLSAIYAGKGGFVIGNSRNDKNNRMLYRINSLKRIDGNTVINSTPLFAVQKARQVHPRATHFMRTASFNSAAKMKAIFLVEAKKQLSRYT